MIAPDPERVRGDLSDPGRRRALHRTGLLDGSPETVFDRLTRMACSLVGCEVALVSLVDHDRQVFKSAVGLAEPWKSRRETPLSHSFCQYVVAGEAPLIVADARTVPFLLNNRAVPELGVVAYLGVPLRAPSGHVLGAFCAIAPEPRQWSGTDTAWLDDLAGIAQSEILLRHEAGTDPLTGAANRRRFDAALDQRLDVARARRERCTVVTLDLDRFKPINDLYGHAVGDAVLRLVAERLVAAVGPTDLVGRLGGDEFAVLFADGLDPALERQRASALRLAIAAPMQVDGRLLRIDVSTGIAAVGTDGLAEATAERLMARADAGLYRMKAGRQPRP